MQLSESQAPDTFCKSQKIQKPILLTPSLKVPSSTTPFIHPAARWYVPRVCAAKSLRRKLHDMLVWEHLCTRLSHTILIHSQLCKIRAILFILPGVSQRKELSQGSIPRSPGEKPSSVCQLCRLPGPRGKDHGQSGLVIWNFVRTQPQPLSRSDSLVVSVGILQRSRPKAMHIYRNVSWGTSSCSYGVICVPTPISSWIPMCYRRDPVRGNWISME